MRLKLLGAHNWQNVCAAVTATWQITQNIAALRSVIAGFSGLEHRLELVTTTNGVGLLRRQLRHHAGNRHRRSAGF